MDGLNDWLDEQKNGCVFGWMYGWMDGMTDGWMNECIVGLDGWMVC
jgi:hypothetical protein